MTILEQKQALGDEIKQIQVLIDLETDATLKSILELKQNACLKKLVALTTASNLPTPTQEPQKEECSQVLLQNNQSMHKDQVVIEESMPTRPAESEMAVQNDITESPQNSKAVPTSQTPIVHPDQVAIHNDIYKVNLGKMGAWESNLLFSLFSRFKDQQDTCIQFTSQEVKELIGAPKIDETNLLRIVETLWKNVRTANFWEIVRFVENGEELTERTNYFLFKHFTITSDKTPRLRYIKVGINTPYFTHLLNDLNANFTSFQLKTFLSLRSKYAKTLYRLLVRFEDIKKNCMCDVFTYKNDFNGFKEFMGIPKSLSIRDIDEYILKPACRELATPFEEGYDPKNPNRDLPYETIFYVKEKKGRGNKVVGITFHFMPHPHADMQKEILKRHTQNRIQDTIVKVQSKKRKEENEQVMAQRKAQQGYYNKQERKSIERFCGLRGSLYIQNPEHIFQNVKLISTLTRLGDNPSIVCLFQLIPTHPKDRIYASYCTEHLERFDVNSPDCFTHIFKDHEDFLNNFVKDAQ
ncbi:replication initiation protein [Helicobacter felis]|uniref:replication initiation protein n=1 Tax=Helicobacter felis TaxID=214 RepID=UPI000EF75460|nr:replication initiation protein [Helicobacter felis]